MTAPPPELHAESLGPYPLQEDEATASALIRHLLLCSLELGHRGISGDLSDEQKIANSAIFVNTWSTMHLLRIIRSELPDRADAVARGLWNLWEDGGDMHELIGDYLRAEGIDPAAKIVFPSDGGAR